MKRITFCLLLLMQTLMGRTYAQEVQEIAKKALGATVSITLFNIAYSDNVKGSGFVVEKDIIATNYHVISLGNLGYIQKSQTDTTRHAIKRLIAVDPENDLALIEVENLGLPILPLGTEELSVGEKIYVAGNPMGLTGTFSDGIVSANRKIEEKQVIQITAPISSGSSGGPVINSKGKVVGVVFSTYRNGQNLNFVVPAEKLVALLAKKRIPIPLQQVQDPATPEEEMSTLLTERFNDAQSAKLKGLKIKQGFPSVIETSTKYGYIYNAAPGLRYRPDFYLEAKMKMQVGKQACLYWGNLAPGMLDYTNNTIGTRNIYQRFCQKDGVATLGKSVNDEYTDLEEDLTLPDFKKNEFFTLKIRKKVDTLYYSVNGVTVFKQPYRVYLGNRVGVGSEEVGAKVAIDYLTVKQTATKEFATYVADTTLKAHKLPEGFNSKYNDLFPVVSLDGQTLYFTRYQSPQNLGKSKASDVYEGSLASLKPSSTNVHKYNTEGNDYCFSLSNDGGNLFLESYTTEEYNRVRKKAYLTTFSLGKEESKDWPNFKSFYCYEDYSVYTINKEENVVVVSLKRADTFGNSDLYVSRKDKEGNWSEMLNLGQLINTEYDEGSAHITADNKYLLFSSEGHPGYGSGDLFISERLDSTWLNWSKPLNLGPGINTKGDENYPFLHLKTNELYFTRTDIDKDGDMYKANLKPDFKSNVTIGILSFDKTGLEVEITSASDNTRQKFQLGNRKEVHFVFQNKKKYLIKTLQGKEKVGEKELDLTQKEGFREENIKL